MKIKICGITTADDALMAAEAGADAIGLNFVGGPRRIDVARAEEILRSLPPLVTPVALVSLADGCLNEQVAELLATQWVSTIQVYGDVTVEAVERLAWEGYRAIVPLPIRDESFAVAVAAEVSPKAAAVLLDAHDPDRLGGTGKTIGWSWVRQAREQGHLTGWLPILLAGGLKPANVAEAIRECRPYGVDVSSGVESSPGRKDPDKVRCFIEEARRALQTT
jgi:phosphoribosylanthranilate isomerase